MVWALIEGLAGVADRGRALDAVRLSPRWEAAGIGAAEVSVGYEASGAALSYRYARGPRTVTLDVQADAAHVEWHVLLPTGHRASQARVDGRAVPVGHESIEASPYANGSGDVRGGAHIEIDFTAA
jgi:hypothetical protein